MTGLIPFNRKNTNVANAGFDDFYNMFDNFFGDRWVQGRNVGNDLFRIDVKEKDNEYVVEAELPGIKKDEIDLNVDDKMLSISVNKTEKVDEEKENYIHRERRSASMSRSIRLMGANLADIKAKLDDGILTITVPKQSKMPDQRRVAIE